MHNNEKERDRERKSYEKARKKTMTNHASGPLSTSICVLNGTPQGVAKSFQ